MDQKYLEKSFLESSMKQNLNLLWAGNYLHSIYIVLTIIYIVWDIIQPIIKLKFVGGYVLVVHKLSFRRFWYGSGAVSGRQEQLYLLSSHASLSNSTPPKVKIN